MERDKDREEASTPGRSNAAMRWRTIWRPTSFYLMFTIPVVLLLGLHMFQYRDNPRRFALILTLMFVFLGILLLRAIMDVFEICRRQLTGRQNSFRETLGAQDFMRELGNHLSQKRRK